MAFGHTTTFTLNINIFLMRVPVFGAAMENLQLSLLNLKEKKPHKDAKSVLTRFRGSKFEPKDLI